MRGTRTIGCEAEYQNRENRLHDAQGKSELECHVCDTEVVCPAVRRSKNRVFNLYVGVRGEEGKGTLRAGDQYRVEECKQ